MDSVYSVDLRKIIKSTSLNVFFMPENGEDILVSSTDVNRSGLELSGYTEFFDESRLEIFGSTEMGLLRSFSEEDREKALESFFSKRPPAIVFSRGIVPTDEIMQKAVKYSVPLLGTTEATSGILAALISFLNVELAPRITRHGVMVEVYGEGILIVGDSGIGKSETAIELLKRGHRLIADDAVEIRRVSEKSLVASSPANIRHFVELRGIGIINAMRVFGSGAVKLTEKIDMCIKLEKWQEDRVYDRMGSESEYAEILGIKVPVTTIPVRPGRNLAIIIEVASINNRQKKLGYDATKELMENLGIKMPETSEGRKINIQI